MKEIQKYRKATAEALGHKDISEPQATAIIVLIDGVIYEWLPDKDANQREMVEDWLIEQHLDVRFVFEQDNGTWLVEICKILKDGFMEIYCMYYDKSKSTAFMKAFMDYKTKQQ